jgi:predicted DNA-binding WGR domain protein
MGGSCGQTGNNVSKSAVQADECYTVELLLDGAHAVRQYKVWHKGTTYMCVLLEETSDILNWVRVGDRMNIRYFDTDQTVVSEYLETEVRKVKKGNQGRLKGQYLLDLEIRESRH